MADFREGRISGLRKAMSDAGVDAFLVTALPNVSYLTGFTGSSGFVLVTSRETFFMTDSRYETQSAEEVKGFELVIHRARWTDEMARLAADHGVKRLGFEARGVSYDTHGGLVKAMCGAELVAVKDAVEKLRIIKDEGEVGRITEAVRRAETGFSENISRVAAGMIERETAIGLEFNIRQLGARKLPFDVIMASGHRAALPHGIASEKEMEPGDSVIIDFGGEAEGYQSDITRSGVLGRPDRKQAEVYGIVAEAQQRAIDAVRPGVTCKEVDQAARGYIASKGYGEYFGHGLGHGVGLDVHEAPSVSPLSEDTVEEGMVFTIEPGIYLPGWGGFRIEDMVVVTSDGCRVLTTLPRDISFR